MHLAISATQTCSLACLVALLWRPGGPGSILGHWGAQEKNTWKSSFEFVLIVGGFMDPILTAFWAPWTKNLCLFMLVSSFFFLMVFGSESGCLGLENKHLAWDFLQQSTFAEIGFLMLPGSSFHDFGWPSGPIFMTFVALETGLKFDDFSR